MFFSSWLFKLPILRNYDAITLGRWVFFREARDLVSPLLIRHEQVHLEQIGAIGMLRFYSAYILYFLAGAIRLKSWDRAYQAIPFEAEAYAAEQMNP